MQHYLYVIKSIKYGRKYIGITENIAKRLEKHNHGATRSTKAYMPWLLMYSEVFSSKREVRKREFALKHNSKAREALFNKIEAAGMKLAPSSNG